mmetsp:Transcript_85636/g.277368  ORF Transcript_85636/g.277368 Transcript_85636/m.277368 type:complete len:217 (+) Transcript_85636:596-1246(+)
MQTQGNMHALEVANKEVSAVLAGLGQRVRRWAPRRVVARVARDHCRVHGQHLRERRGQLKHVQRQVIKFLAPTPVAEHVHGMAKLVRDGGSLLGAQELAVAQGGRLEVHAEVDVARAEEHGAGRQARGAAEEPARRVQPHIAEAQPPAGLPGARRAVQDLVGKHRGVPAAAERRPGPGKLPEGHVARAAHHLHEPRQRGARGQELREAPGVSLPRD